MITDEAWEKKQKNPQKLEPALITKNLINVPPICVKMSKPIY